MQKEMPRNDVIHVKDNLQINFSFNYFNIFSGAINSRIWKRCQTNVCLSTAVPFMFLLLLKANIVITTTSKHRGLNQYEYLIEFILQLLQTHSHSYFTQTYQERFGIICRWPYLQGSSRSLAAVKKETILLWILVLFGEEGSQAGCLGRREREIVREKGTKK